MCLVLWILSLPLKKAQGTFLFLNFLLNNKHLQIPADMENWEDTTKSIGLPRRESVKLSKCQDLVNFIKKALDMYISNTLHFTRIWHLRKPSKKENSCLSHLREKNNNNNKQKTQKRKKKKPDNKTHNLNNCPEYCRILLTLIYSVLEKVTAKEQKYSFSQHNANYIFWHPPTCLEGASRKRTCKYWCWGQYFPSSFPKGICNSDFLHQLTETLQMYWTIGPTRHIFGLSLDREQLWSYMAFQLGKMLTISYTSWESYVQKDKWPRIKQKACRNKTRSFVS